MQEGTLVKTDGLVDSLPKLIKTRQILVRFFGGEEKIKSAPEKSFFGRLAKKKALVLGGKMTPDKISKIMKSMTSHIYFGNIYGVLFNLAILASHAQSNGLVVFLKQDNFYETLSVYYMRASLDEARKQFIIQRLFYWLNAKFVPNNLLVTSVVRQLSIFLPFRTYQTFEQGLYQSLCNKIMQVLKGRANEVQIFESFEDYVEQFAKVVGVKLENLENLFVAFFFVLFLVLFAFLMIRKQIFKHLMRTVRKLLLLVNAFYRKFRTKFRTSRFFKTKNSKNKPNLKRVHFELS